jgi:hypothetical protein
LRTGPSLLQRLRGEDGPPWSTRTLCPRLITGYGDECRATGSGSTTGATEPWKPTKSRHTTQPARRAPREGVRPRRPRCGHSRFRPGLRELGTSLLDSCLGTRSRSAASQNRPPQGVYALHHGVIRGGGRIRCETGSFAATSRDGRSPSAAHRRDPAAIQRLAAAHPVARDRLLRHAHRACRRSIHTEHAMMNRPPDGAGAVVRRCPWPSIGKHSPKGLRGPGWIRAST